MRNGVEDEEEVEEEVRLEEGGGVELGKIRGGGGRGMMEEEVDEGWSGSRSE